MSRRCRLGLRRMGFSSQPRTSEVLLQDLPLTGAALIDQWRADRGLSADRTTWTGLKNGHVWSESTNVPALTTLTQGGLTALGGNGANTVYTNTTVPPLLAGTGTAFSRFTVFEINAALDGSIVPTLWSMSGNTATQPYHIHRWTNTDERLSITRRPNPSSAAVTAALDTRYYGHWAHGCTLIFEEHFSGTAVTTLLNGMVIQSAAGLNVGACTFTRMSLWMQNINGALSQPGNFRIAEFDLYLGDQLSNRGEIWDLLYARYLAPLLPGCTVLATDALAKSCANVSIVARPIHTDPESDLQSITWWSHAKAQAAFAQRDVANDNFTLTLSVLDRTNPAIDSHNVLSIKSAADSFWHLFFDMHNDALTYSKGPSANSLAFATVATNPIASGSTVETGCTYPDQTGPAVPDTNEYLMFRGVGGSGDGNYVFYRSTDSGVTWDDLHPNWINGESTRSAYLFQPRVDSQGRIVVAFCFRESADAAHVNNIYFRRSSDNGATWEKLDGTAQTVPMTSSNLGTPDWAIAMNTGFINSGGLGLDADDNPFVIPSWDQGGNTGDTQYVCVRWTGSAFTTHVLGGLTSNYHFPGTISAARVARGIPLDEKNGRVYFVTVASDLGEGIWCASTSVSDWGTWTWKRISAIDVGCWEPNWDVTRWVRDSVLSMFVQRVPFSFSNIDPIDANALPQPCGKLDIPVAGLV